MDSSAIYQWCVHFKDSRYLSVNATGYMSDGEGYVEFFIPSEHGLRPVASFVNVREVTNFAHNHPSSCGCFYENQ